MNDFNILFTLAIALLAGLFLSRIVKPLGLPAVTGYLLAGILLGPYCLGSFGITGLFHDMSEQNPAMVSMASIVQDAALGFIAFAIGTEFKLSSLKKTGRQATVVGIFQALVAMLLVDGALIGLHFLLGEERLPLSVCITLGAIATATAPAATLMVVRQYKARGKVTDILLPVVALDDAVGLVVFAISCGVAHTIHTTGPIDVISMVVSPLLEVILSIALGALMGLLFTLCERFFHSRSKRMAVSVTFVMLTVAISSLEFHPFGVHIAFSPLLACMMLGTVFCNICDFSEELMDRADRWTAPLLILFFVISGAELDLSVFSKWTFVLIGIVYIIARSIGKYFGASISARMTHCDSNIVKYLGITLLPQAGVALGMAGKASEFGGETGALVLSITLFAVLIYELVGPFLTKVALIKSGDIQLDGKVSAREEHKKKLSQKASLPTEQVQK